MTNIFSLIKESSIPENIFSNRYSNEKFFESSINMLESFEDSITSDTMSLYKAISESNDVKDENNAIKEFIISTQKKLDDLSNDILSTASRFSIALNNYCDNAKEKAKYVSEYGSRAESISYTSPYTTFKVDNLLNPSVPRMNPYKIFETEFLNIAEMLQNLPVTISNKDKLEVVATVYDKFKNSLGDITKNKIYENIFGASTISGSFSTTLFSLFKEEINEDYTITYKEYSDAVECISDSSAYIDAINKMTDSLINDLRHIVEDMNEIILGASKNRYKVDTKQDGIRNTTYSVDIYTSNKIMWLVEEKIQQIVDVYDKYILALGTKIDCILSYIKQSSDIISSFAFGLSENICAPSDSSPEETSETDNDEVEDPDMSGDDPESFGDETPINDDTSDDDDLDTETDNSEDEDSDYELEEDNEITPDFEESEDEELQEAVREFYMALHEYEVISNREAILESSLLILKEEENEGDNKGNAESETKDEKPDSIKNTRELVGKAGEEKKSAWKKVIGAAKTLWDKFKNNIINNYGRKVDKLKANEKYINLDPLDHEISMPVIHHDRIDQIRVPDLNWDAMKDKLGSEADFMGSDNSLKNFIPTGNDPKTGKAKTINQMVIDFVIEPDQTVKNSKDVTPSKIYNEYCKNFIKIMDKLKDITNVIEKGERQANIIAKNMAANEQGNLADPLQMYFMEMEDLGKDKEDKSGSDNKTEGDSKDSSVETKLKVYFSTCGKILAAKMTVCEKVFNEYYSYLMWHIGKKSKGISSENKKANGDTVTTFNSKQDAQPA